MCILENVTLVHCCCFFYFKIVVSLFVAVILDNLELDEDIKKLKQVWSDVFQCIFAVTFFLYIMQENEWLFTNDV